MKFKGRKVLVSVFMAVVVLAGVFAYKVNHKVVDAGTKSFTIEVKSERDNLDKTIKCTSDEKTLGAYVRTLKDCTWEDSSYGTYIKGWYGCSEDKTNQYWWAVYEDGQESANGVDLIQLEDGHEYEFSLVQGW